MNKNLYKGILNWYGQSITLYRYASRRELAMLYFCREIAKLADTSWHRVYNYFMSGEKDNYIITKEEKNVKI